MLKHYFAVIDINSKETVIDPQVMDAVSVPDELILYIADSLKWITSLWNGKILKPSFSYYGFSYIEKENIVHLNELLRKWIELFGLATENEICLTVGYTCEQEVLKPDLYFITKTELIGVLVKLTTLCDKAIREGMKILYNGI